MVERALTALIDNNRDDEMCSVQYRRVSGSGIIVSKMKKKSSNFKSNKRKITNTKTNNCTQGFVELKQTSELETVCFN